MTWSTQPTRTSVRAHKLWRRAVLDRSDGRCAIAGPRCDGAAVEADHIVPVAEGGAEHDVTNGQGVCTPCHAAKTAAEAARGRQRRRDAARRPRRRHPAEL